MGYRRAVASEGRGQGAALLKSSGCCFWTRASFEHIQSCSIKASSAFLHIDPGGSGLLIHYSIWCELYKRASNSLTLFAAETQSAPQRQMQWKGKWAKHCTPHAPGMSPSFRKRLQALGLLAVGTLPFPWLGLLCRWRVRTRGLSWPFVLRYERISWVFSIPLNYQDPGRK